MPQKSIKFISSVTDSAKPNSEFEVHAHYNEFEIYYFLEGNLYFALDGKRYNVENGTIILISDGMLHKPIIKSTCRYVRKRILFDKKIFTNFDVSAFDFYVSLRKKGFYIIEEKYVKSLKLNLLFEQIEQSLSKNTPYDDFCALINLFSMLIKIDKSGVNTNAYHLYSNSKKVTDMVKYIDDHISENINYETLSKRFFVTEKYLYKLFKKETGFALGDYVKERRIIKAQSVLNAGGSAKEAANIAGFKDYTVFYRNFLQKVGIPPAKYISNIKNGS